MPGDADLTGVTVLVTRPAHQAQHLCELIEAAGGVALRFPVIAIAPPADPRAAAAIASHLDEYDIVIFISANAVEHGLPLIRQAYDELPARPRLAAIGAATARCLEQAWRQPDIIPAHGHDSEALLALPALRAVSGKRIAIFRGAGGRELLGDTLRQRGARVDYADVYQRAKPRAQDLPLLRAGARGKIDVIVVTSNEGIENLLELTGEGARTTLLQTPLALLSTRGATLAAARGFTGPLLVAAEATDAGLIDAIRRWRTATAGNGKGN